MPTEWPGIVAVNAKRYLKGASDATIRDRYILSELKRRGKILFNESGDDLSWQMEFKQPPVQQAGSFQSIDYTQRDLYKRNTIDWRGYAAPDALDEKIKEMNKGNVALIKYYADKMPKLVKSITNRLDDDFFVDGYATGNENALCGIESFCGTGTTVAADRIAKPDDTYGLLDTDLQAYGGSWSAVGTAPNASVNTDWPNGSGSVEYDFNSPRLPNWSSNGWGTSAQTWVANGERVLRQTTLWTRHGNGADQVADCYVMATELYYDYLNQQAANRRIVVPHKDTQDLGFGDFTMQEGVKLMPAYGVPTGTFYGLNFDQMELRCLYPQLFKEEGPEYDMREGAYLFNVRFFGNLKFQSPKYFSKGKNYAS